jgi:hypothetical protein
MNQIVQKEDIANLIRNYVHYDNLVTNFQKQTQNARIVRDDFEKRTINELKVSGMENAIIQIVGGKLKVVEEKHSSPLSFKSLEESLHKYYQFNKKPDETSNIIKFIKENREFETSLKLKKILQLPPQPGPKV